MDIKETIESEFDNFFEFDSDERRYVTVVSCKLFARHIAEMATKSIKQERDELFEAIQHPSYDRCGAEEA